MKSALPIELAEKSVRELILTVTMHAGALLLLVAAIDFILSSPADYFEECRISRWKAYIPFYGFYMLLKQHRLHDYFWFWLPLHIVWMPEISHFLDNPGSLSRTQIIWILLSVLTIGGLAFCIDSDSDLGYIRSAYAALIPWFTSLLSIYLILQAVLGIPSE